MFLPFKFNLFKVGTMDKKDLQYFKEKLEKEKIGLENSLGSVAKQDAKNPDDWIPQRPDLTPQSADQIEMASVTEQFEAQHSVENVLEERLNEVKAALKRIEQGTYGRCEEDKETILKARLEANPATKYCQKHADFE